MLATAKDLMPIDSIGLADTLGLASMVLISLIIVVTAGFMLTRSYIAGETRKWEQREMHTSQVYRDMVTQVTASRDKDMALLKDALDDNREQISLMRGVIEKQKVSDKALRDIFEQLSSILQDRCRHHFHFQTPQKPTP